MSVSRRKGHSSREGKCLVLSALGDRDMVPPSLISSLAVSPDPVKPWTMKGGRGRASLMLSSRMPVIPT